jgi:hypothetical protein
VRCPTTPSATTSASYGCQQVCVVRCELPRTRVTVALEPWAVSEWDGRLVVSNADALQTLLRHLPGADSDQQVRHDCAQTTARPPRHRRRERVAEHVQPCRLAVPPRHTSHPPPFCRVPPPPLPVLAPALAHCLAVADPPAARANAAGFSRQPGVNQIPRARHADPRHRAPLPAEPRAQGGGGRARGFGGRAGRAESGGRALIQVVTDAPASPAPLHPPLFAPPPPLRPPLPPTPRACGGALCSPRARLQQNTAPHTALHALRAHCRPLLLLEYPFTYLP